MEKPLVRPPSQYIDGGHHGDGDRYSKAGQDLCVIKEDEVLANGGDEDPELFGDGEQDVRGVGEPEGSGDGSTVARRRREPACAPGHEEDVDSIKSMPISESSG